MYREETINLLKEWRKYLVKLQVANYKTSQKYSIQSFWLKFFITIFSGFSTALSISAISNDAIAAVIVKIIGVLSIITTFLNVVEPKLSFSNSASKYSAQSTNYRKIILMIEKQLVVQNLAEEILLNDIIKATQGLEANNLIIPEKFYVEREGARDEIINSNVVYRRSTMIDSGEHFEIGTHHSL